MEFKAKLIKIGNSKGIIIPKKILEKIGKDDEYIVSIRKKKSKNQRLTVSKIDDLFERQDILRSLEEEK